MATTQKQRDAFGPLLFKLRRAKGFTQPKLGAELGITKAAVSGWERCLFAPESRDLAVHLDDLLDAGGRLLDILGYARPSAAETADQKIARLSAEVAELQRSRGVQPPKRRPRRDDR
jgi:transcriptional regulator with XRE-family HTH domain